MIFSLHAARAQSEAPLEWIQRFRLLLDHMQAQLFVVVLESCFQACRGETDVYSPAARCKFPLTKGSVGELLMNEVNRFRLKLPPVYFHEIPGLRHDVLARLLVSRAVPEPRFLEVLVFGRCAFSAVGSGDDQM